MTLSAISYLGVAFATLILLLGELLKNETKKEYVKKGHKWKNVIISSVVSGILFGLTSAYFISSSNKIEELNLYVVPFSVTVLAYTIAQSYMTDMKVLMINRNILRVAMIAMYILTMYNIFSNETFRPNLVPVLLFSLLIVLIFIFSGIGASDVRAIAVALPYVVSIGGFDAIIMFIYTLIAVAIGMELRNQFRDRKRMKKFKEDNAEAYKNMNRLLFYKLARKMINDKKTEEQKATPVGPFMIAPFLLFLIIYSINS